MVSDETSIVRGVGLRPDLCCRITPPCRKEPNVNPLSRTLALSIAALALAATAAPADARGRHGGHGHGHAAHVHGHGHGHGGHGHHRHHHPGVFWGGLGLGIGLAAIYHHHQQAGVTWQPAYAVAPPPVAYYDAPPALPRAPEPVIYPRQGQSPAQTEADRQDCNRWATTQPGAMADAGMFHRATIACMEGRGYTVR
jgi:hypothetical protein